MGTRFKVYSEHKALSRLGVPERHQLRIARDSMTKHCIGLAVLGGPNHYQSAEIIHRLTGVFAGIDADCTCKR